MINQETLDAIGNITSDFIQIWHVWLTMVVFSWHWWVDVGLAILPWILWRIVRDKEQANRLLYAGFATMLMATYLDIVGMTQGLWTYHTWVIPLMPEFLPWDLSVMPVMAMLFYQFKPKINPWIKGAFFGALGSFVSEPIFEWLDIYERLNWEYYYSFPIYIAVYMIGYFIYKRSGNDFTKATCAK